MQLASLPTRITPMFGPNATQPDTTSTLIFTMNTMKQLSRFSIWGAIFAIGALSSGGALAAKPAPKNKPPVAADQSVLLKVDRTAWINLEATDPEGAAVTFEIVSQPQHGTLGDGPIFWAMAAKVAPDINMPIMPGNGGIKRYYPASGYSGSDSFTFRASDGKKWSNVATVTINVTTANRAPEAYPLEVQNKRGSKTFIFPPTSDADGDPTTVVIKTQPTHGTLRLATEEEYPMWVADAPVDPGFGQIIPLNVGATATPSLISVDPVLITDPMEPGFGVHPVSPPIITIDPIVITDPIDPGFGLHPIDPIMTTMLPIFVRPYIYEQNLWEKGLPAPTADSFTFVANDGTDDSAPATVSISLLPPNVPPVVVIGADPVVDAWTTNTTAVVVAGSTGSVSVKLDSNDSTDPDGEPYSLWTQWNDLGFIPAPLPGQAPPRVVAPVSTPVGWGNEVVLSLAAGTHSIEAAVTDSDSATTNGAVTVEVLTAYSAVQRLDADLVTATTPSKSVSALREMLKSASDAFAKNKTRVGSAWLVKYAGSVRSKLGKPNAKVAAALAKTAQQVIDGVTAKAPKPEPIMIPMVK